MVSVCMATYNGERFILEQIQSILSQLNTDDELVISDDGSTDSTIEIINSIKDKRIKFYKNSFKNVVQNFEFSIGKAQGEHIFLSDQDDIWHPDRVKIVLDCFRSTNADLVISNVAYIDQNGIVQKDEFYKNGFKKGFWANLKKNNFIGSAMAFKQSSKKWFLPFPYNLPMHDWWIGLKIAKHGKIEFLDQKLHLYRRHGNNVTTGEKSTFANIIYWRWIIIKNLF